MFITIFIIFLVGYCFIVFEHVNHINKAATALLLGVILWVIYAIDTENILMCGYSQAWNSASLKLCDYTIRGFIHKELFHHLSEISSILFFLIGAMTIVELVDKYQGFRLITNKIDCSNISRLLWIVSILTFFMSAVLDNLTTTIVIITVLSKLISKQENRWYFASVVIISANAGGAWSPIGDITTIMLWIGGQVTAKHIISALLAPSLVNVIVSTLIFSYIIKGQTIRPILGEDETKAFTSKKEQTFMLVVGVLALVSVPLFKTMTHLPPFLGMLLGLSVMWIMTDRYLKDRSKEDKRRLTVTAALKEVDIPTVLFFLGILSAVAVLQSAGHLDIMATWLDENIKNIYGINLVIGVISAIVDNVPLVAASMGMYSITDVQSAGYCLNFVQDGIFWTFLAYCSGTGGSLLVIGSAAGVAAMGLEKIGFGWYFKHISWIALVGYLAGALAYYIQIQLF